MTPQAPCPICDRADTRRYRRYTRSVLRLIVNADDFGQTSGINRAVLELHQAGVLTSASLMANADATEEAIRIANATPTLGVGCHIVLTDGSPMLTSDQIPTLLSGSNGQFIPSLGGFVSSLFAGRIKSEEIEAEAIAQIQHLQASGVSIDHVDTHKHLHMFPSVLRPILGAARACGISSIRRPFEPSWAVRSTIGASWLRTAQVHALRRFDSSWRTVLADHGISTTEGTLGMTATGVLNAHSLHALLDRAPAGTWEFVTHPGYVDPDLAVLSTTLQASREIERRALYALQEFHDLDLVSFLAL
jgi:hopanoid biosynthesis associated protein HpnK